MAGRLQGKRIFITGAARGQGRAHAIRMAEEGADIVAVDICEPIGTVLYDGATEDDLDETVRLVEKTGRRIIASKADVRDLNQLRDAVQRGVAGLGGLDVIVANAGIFAGSGSALDVTDQQWDDTIAINLKGVWNTVRAGLPHMLQGANGGSIILTSSSVSLMATPNIIHYSAAKYGVIGIMRTLAVELAQHSIRVNTIHPTSVDTPMANNMHTFKLFRPDLEEPTHQDVKEVYEQLNLLPVMFIEPEYVAHACVYLASDESKYVTGSTFSIDAGSSIK
jgi:(+)-trans-carveol dehydrogenase